MIVTMLATCFPGPAALAALYAAGVAATRAYMQPRRRWTLGWLLPAYNAAMALAAACVCAAALAAASQSGAGAGLVARAHYATKVAAGLDTVALLVRKKTRRVTPAHVYGRAAALFPLWPLTYAPASIDHAAAGAVALAVAVSMDALAQTLVYAYYTVASLGLALLLPGATRTWIARVHAAQTAAAAAAFAAARAGPAAAAHLAHLAVSAALALAANRPKRPCATKA